MAHHTDSDDRLARLRAVDRTGYYASDQPASAQDGSGAVVVSVDPTDRVLRVDLLGDHPRTRTPAGLRDAVEEAYRDARLARLAASRPAPPDVRERRTVPTAHRLERTRLTVENRMGTGWRPDAGELGPHSFSYREPRADVGVSDNGCVTVTLDLAGPHGSLDADAGWLSTAKTSRVSQAVTEAFAHAYRERDHRG